MSCQQCQSEVIGSPDAKVWLRRIGQKVVVRFFCSDACRDVWLAAGIDRIRRALAEWEAALN